MLESHYPHPPYFDTFVSRATAIQPPISFYCRSLPDMMFRLPVALTVLLSLITVASAGPTRYGGRKCGNHPTSEDIDAKEGNFMDALSKTDGPVGLAGKFSNHTIPVRFHVIYSGKKLSQGYVP